MDEVIARPKIVEHSGILVVRDDLMPGGTKARVLPALFDSHTEYVYASPVQGYAQVALAYCAKAHSKRATIFCAARKQRHPRTVEAARAGARIVEVGRLATSASCRSVPANTALCRVPSCCLSASTCRPFVTGLRI